jgi:hypothetical protein
MDYMFFICTDPEAPEPKPEDDNVDEWIDDLAASGARITGNRLREPDDATTVRVRDGELLISDGPFAETKEWIAGFDVIRCADLDEAVQIAAKHPMAKFGRIEIRPFWPTEF